MMVRFEHGTDEQHVIGGREGKRCGAFAGIWGRISEDGWRA